MKTILIITSLVSCSSSIYFYLKCRRLTESNRSLNKKIDILEQHLLFNIGILKELSYEATKWSDSFKLKPLYDFFHKRFSYSLPGFVFSNILKVTNLLYDNCIQEKLASKINLTQKETITCCLMLLGFTPVVIATLLEYKDVYGVYMLKSRLKIKLNLGDEDRSLEMYLKGGKNRIMSDTFNF